MPGVAPVARVDVEPELPAREGGGVGRQLGAGDLEVFGAHLVGVTWLGLDNGTFWSNMTSSVDVWKDVVNGVWKSVAFGAVVSLIAVFQGYTTPPTSEGVAYATTRTVVTSSLAILALDFMLTALMFTGGNG